MFETTKRSVVILAVAVGLLMAAAPAQAAIIPAAYWSFDVSGSLGADSTGNGHTGSMTGGAVYDSSGRFGGGALKLTGSSDGMYMPVASGVSLPAGSDYTIAAWFKGIFNNGWSVLTFSNNAGGTAAGNEAMVTTSGYGGADAWSLGSWHAGNLTGFQDSGGNIPAADRPGGSEASQWHFIVVVGTSTDSKYYMDVGGAMTLIGTSSGGKTANSSVINIGYQANASGRSFADYLDEVRIYNQALTTGEIGALYATNNIPEPATMAFLAIGGLAMAGGAIRRRRRI